MWSGTSSIRYGYSTQKCAKESLGTHARTPKYTGRLRRKQPLLFHPLFHFGTRHPCCSSIFIIRLIASALLFQINIAAASVREGIQLRNSGSIELFSQSGMTCGEISPSFRGRKTGETAGGGTIWKIFLRAMVPGEFIASVASHRKLELFESIMHETLL